MAADIWYRTTQAVKERKYVASSTFATFFQLAARVLLYAISHRQNSTYHGLCYTSTGKNETYVNGSTMKDQSEDPSHHERTLSHGATSHSDIGRACVC